MSEHSIRCYLLRSREGDKVAELCEFSDGRVAVRWMRDGYPSSSVWWDSMDDARAIHTGVGSWTIESVDTA